MAIVVERHVFFLRAVGQTIDTLSYPSPKSRGGREYVRLMLRLEHRRLPWPGEKHRSLVYLDDSQLGAVPIEQLKTPKVEVPQFRPWRLELQTADTNLMRNFLLGKDFSHPKLLVADVPNPELLMSRSAMARHLFDEFSKRRNKQWIWLHTPHMPHDVAREVWLPYDPTHPEQREPDRDQWLREAKHWLANGPERVMGPRDTFGLSMAKMVNNQKVYDPHTIIPLGIAYCLRYYDKHAPLEAGVPTAPRGVASRLQDYLKQAQPTGKPDIWYAMGAVYIPDQAIGRQGLETYRKGQRVPLAPGKTLTTRRLFKVMGRTVAEARQNAEAYLAKLKENPATEYIGYKWGNAWERNKQELINHQVWVRQKKSRPKVNEAFYRRDSLYRVY